jgi:thiol reductant ABC exporter CydD subunit
MSAVDPRLGRYARSTRWFMVVAVALGLVTAVLVVAQAWLVADIVSGAFSRHLDLRQLRLPVIVLLAAIVGRATVSWGSETAAQRSSARAKSELRRALLDKVMALGPESLDQESTGEVAVLATRGVDALDGYFARYLPQLVLAVIVPLVILVVVASRDWISAVIIAFTVPLIPVFMALVGATTAERTSRQVRTLQRLARHFLDVVAGLPTLKVFGRAKAQAATIRDLSTRYRQTALAALKVSFLSSLILELVATISVAMVAVAVGLRLMGGHLTLMTALFVLILAPEAYLPLRLLGQNYHASAEGMAAADQVFEILERPLPSAGDRTDLPDPSLTGLAVERLVVGYPDRPEPALDGVTLTVAPGEVVALTGPSGCGKTTLLKVLLGFARPLSGTVRIGSCDLADLDPDAWRAQVAWVPQRPHLFAGSLADNIALGRPGATAGQLRRAVADAGLTDLVARLPGGLETTLGEGGSGLSAGERQRLALARAFLRDAPLLLLDEPTANLDGDTEDQVLDAVRRLVRGRTAVVVAHRPALAALADRVVRLQPTDVPA